MAPCYSNKIQPSSTSVVRGIRQFVGRCYRRESSMLPLLASSASHRHLHPPTPRTTFPSPLCPRSCRTCPSPRQFRQPTTAWHRTSRHLRRSLARARVWTRACRWDRIRSYRVCAFSPRLWNFRISTALWRLSSTPPRLPSTSHSLRSVGTSGLGSI